VPAMRDRGFGRVIQLASGEATQPFAFMPDYAAARRRWSTSLLAWPRSSQAAASPPTPVSPGIVVTAGLEGFYRRGR
ncbi:MAG TPA: hypothetical protein VJL85_04260, partial [Gaiellaceae bacterium]|nr:hypothetical protein [Gaiellaceae bacterium]